MAEKTSPWVIFNAVLGAVAAVITACTGLYLALRSDPGPPAQPTPEPIVEIEQPSGAVTYARTPWLGIELRQDGNPVQLSSLNSSWSEFEAEIAPGPFELTVTRGVDDPNIGILAWHDDSIFQCVRDNTLHLPGTGIAGAQFAVPILYLDREGFNYYDTQRMKRIAEDQYSIFVSTIGSGELELPLTRFAGPLYLIVFRSPADFSMTATSHNYELIVLRR